MCYRNILRSTQSMSGLGLTGPIFSTNNMQMEVFMGATPAPSTFTDFYCDTINAAFEEISRRKAMQGTESIITRYEESPYGGFRVHSMSAELFVDDLLDPVYPMKRATGFVQQKSLYR